MPFSKSGLIVGRGVSNSTGTVSGLVQHTYTSSDLLSEISASGYFPDNFGAGSDEISIDDIMIVQGNGNDRAYKITSLSPAAIVETIISDNPFDQSLNTSDNVVFNEVNTPQLTSDHVITDLITEKTLSNGVVVGSVLKAENIDSTISTNPVKITEKALFLNDGNKMTIQMGDGVTSPATQDVLLHLQGKKNADFWQEGDVDTVGGITTPIHIYTSDGNSNMFRECLDDTGDAVIDLGAAGIMRDMKFRTGGDFLSPTSPGVIPDYQGMGKVSPLDAMMLRGSDQVGQFFTGIELPTTGGTPAILDYYEEEEVTGLTWTGAFTVGQATTIRYARLGCFVTLSIAAENAAQNTSDQVRLGAGALPVKLRPFANVHLPVISTVDFGVTDVGMIEIRIDGNVIISKNGGGAFTGAGSLSWLNTMVTYILR